jgi:tetratricopeptide (TPR) repeat protein
MIKTIFNVAMLVVFFGSIMATTSQAQNREIQNTQLFKHYQMKFVFGRKYNDPEVSKDALYSMVALDPTDDSLKLQLAYHYFENNQYASSLFVSADLLSRNPNNSHALRINAVSYDNMGLRDKAIESYESLYLQTFDIGVLYQTAALQFESARYAEAINNADIIATSPKAPEEKITFATDDKKGQEVTLEAAAYNLKAMALKEQGKKDEAKQSFEKALTIAPDFKLAKTNLAEL